MRLVHYELDAGPSKGQYRPAVLMQDHGNGMGDLMVFTRRADGLTPTKILEVSNSRFSELVEPASSSTPAKRGPGRPRKRPAPETAENGGEK